MDEQTNSNQNPFTPTGNFLKDFVKFCSGTEIPSIFAMWCGISGISAALGRRCYIDMGTYNVYPNFYILLVAGSGRNRKSTSIKQIEKIIKQLQPTPNLISQSITPQGLIDAIKVVEVNDSKHLLRETCTGFVIIEELATFLNRKSYEAGLGSLLIPFFDCTDHYEYKTISRGAETITNACLGLLAASTVDWIRNAIPEDAIGGGLTSRFIFVYVEEPPTPVARTTFPPEKKELQEHLARQLNEIQTLNGEFTLTEEAWLYYDEKYKEFYYGSEFYDDRTLAGYASRRYVHVFKLAMVISAARSLDRVITKEDLAGAELILSQAEKHMKHVLSLIVSTDQGILLGQVFKFIASKDKMSRSELLQLMSNRIRARELDELIVTLRDSGYIEEVIEPMGKGTWYRKRGSKPTGR